MPRQPWLEEADVRDRFHQLAATVHPDIASGQSAAFSDLNHAWQTLRAPASRLRHFLELEHPEQLSTTQFTIPSNPDLFIQVSELQHTAKILAAELVESKSPLARALLEPKRLKVLQTVDRLEAEVGNQIAAVHQRIQSPQSTPESLANALNELIFLEKWSGQLRESSHAMR